MFGLAWTTGKQPGLGIRVFSIPTEYQAWIAYPKVGLEEQAALRRTVGLDYQHPDLESYYKLCTQEISPNASHYEM